jgi:hypothetical protein
MAYTTDRTWVAGEVVTAAYLNTYLRDNMKWLSTDKPMCRAYASAAVSHTPAGAYQDLTFNTDRFDNADVHSTTSLTARFTIPTGAGGKWLFGGSISWAANATGVRYASIWANGGAINVESTTTGDGSLNSGTTVVTLYDLSAGQYFTLSGWQNSGGALNMNANSNAFAIWVGV